jgi:hypothetical protein
MYLGHACESRLRAMPVAATQGLKPRRVVRVRLRLLESRLPYVKGHPSGQENRAVYEAQRGTCVRHEV